MSRYRIGKACWWRFGKGRRLTFLTFIGHQGSLEGDQWVPSSKTWHRNVRLDPTRYLGEAAADEIPANVRPRDWSMS